MSKKQNLKDIDPELIERALAFSHPELQDHRRLQSLDLGRPGGKVSKEKPHFKLSERSIVIFPDRETRLVSLHPA
jgi:hypothetical protein